MGVKDRIQVSRRSFTHIYLDYVIIEFLSCIKKNIQKKKPHFSKLENNNICMKQDKYKIIIFILSARLDWVEAASAFAASCFILFFSFFFSCISGVMRLLFMHCSLNSSHKCWLFHGEQCICALFTDPQISLFSNFFIKNESHGTIHTFKNYFAIVFLVFSFQFSVSAK